MPRQIAYDPQALRQNLLDVFWAKGFAETSLTDLEDASGLNRRQLYNGLGDKRAMFLQSLDDFSEQAGRTFLGPLEAPDAGIADIAALLHRFVGMGAVEGPVNGCLVCLTSQEEVATDVDVHRRINSYFDRIEAAYRNALILSAARGDVALKRPQIRDKSAALMAVHVALCILGRAKRPHDELKRMADEAIASIH